MGTSCIRKARDNPLDLDKQIGMVRISRKGELYWSKIGVRSNEVWASQEMGSGWIACREFQQILRRYRRVLVSNAFFDKMMLESTARRYSYRLPKAEWDGLMEQCAQYAGGWSQDHCGYCWVSLDWACRWMEVEQDGQKHRARIDTQRVLGVMKAMAARHGHIEVWEPPVKVEEAFLEKSLGDLSDPPF